MDRTSGDASPSGRLPYTIARSLGNHSMQLVTGGGPDTILSILSEKRLLIDYR